MLGSSSLHVSGPLVLFVIVLVANEEEEQEEEQQEIILFQSYFKNLWLTIDAVFTVSQNVYEVNEAFFLI